MIETKRPTEVCLREVGLRDGLQIEAPVATSDKIELLEAMIAAGHKRIEVAAFVSRSAVPAMADAEEVVRRLPSLPDVEFSALVASLGGAQRAVDVGMSTLEYVVSASNGHSLANVRRSRSEAALATRDVAAVAHSAGGTCEVIIATAWDCPFDGPTQHHDVLDVARVAVESGADAICLADTIGTVTPDRLTSLLESVRHECPGVPIGIHLHNTRGTAVASALAAIQHGVVDLDCSVGGLGGCPFAPGASGNIATEEVVYLCRDMGIATGVDLSRAIDAARLATRVVGHDLPSSLLKAGDRRRSPSVGTQRS